jgi:Flp pilus assembly CpaF family ATPase
MATLAPVKIVIRGPHDSGRTTLASVLRNFLEENGYKHVSVKDTEPLSAEQKAPFWERFTRNRDSRPVEISVELE